MRFFKPSKPNWAPYAIITPFYWVSNIPQAVSTPKEYAAPGSETDAQVFYSVTSTISILTVTPLLLGD